MKMNYALSADKIIAEASKNYTPWIALGKTADQLLTALSRESKSFDKAHEKWSNTKNNRKSKAFIPDEVIKVKKPIIKKERVEHHYIDDVGQSCMLLQ
jgi:thiamine pyrophosphate-dependent acetolactate synthase large subunit-like protein